MPRTTLRIPVERMFTGSVGLVSRATLDKDPHEVASMFDAVARRYDRQAIGFELHSEFVTEARRRLAEGFDNDDPPAELHAVGQ